MFNVTIFLVLFSLLKERCMMKASYKKLWKLLIDKGMKKRDLMEQASISSFSIRKLIRGENVTMEILGKICKALNCTLNDICEFEDADANTD
jgi:DNA-binding Xre family transcriptional regulator